MKNKTKRTFSDLREKLPPLISRDHVGKLQGGVIFPIKSNGIGIGG